MDAANDSIDTDRANYAAYVADRQKNGWSTADVAEYRAAVGEVMKLGSDDDKAAAKEFWALKKLERDYSTAEAITARIKASLAQTRDERKEAA